MPCLQRDKKRTGKNWMPYFQFKAKNKNSMCSSSAPIYMRPRKQSQRKQTKQIINRPKCTHQAMMTTHNLSKPLNVFTPQAHKPTVLNLHPNNVTVLSSSISGGNWRVLRQEMCLRDHLQPTETMGLSGPGPKVVATKRPITRMCMCQNKRVPSWRSLTLENLRAGDAEREFKKILWPGDDRRVDFKDLETCARRMEISRKEDAAVTELLWYIRKPKGSHEIYEAKLLLVEMLIYQGEYERARETLEEVGSARETLEGGQPGPSDYRLPFYRAVIFVLLGKEDEDAKEHWDKFNEISKTHGISPPETDDESTETPRKGLNEEDPLRSDSGPSKTPMAEAFSQFKKHVKELGQEIAAVRCK